MSKTFGIVLLYSIIVTCLWVTEAVPSKHGHFCANDSSQSISCSDGSVISIDENSVRMCYKERCGQKPITGGRSTKKFLEGCHGKQNCTMHESDFVTSQCSSEVNVLEYSYKCIELNRHREETLLLQEGEIKNFQAKKEIHVRSPDYPADIKGSNGKPMTYTCTFTNEGTKQQNTLDLQLQRISLAENSQLLIEIDGERYTSLGIYDIVGRKNCYPIPYNKTIVVYYRQCQKNDARQGSMWITMKASTSLDAKCQVKETLVRGGHACSESASRCLREVDLYADNDICSCSNGGYSTSGPYPPSEGASGLLIGLITLGVLLVIGVLICVPCICIWKARKNKKCERQDTIVYSDTAMPLEYTEPVEASHYTEIGFPRSAEDESGYMIPLKTRNTPANLAASNVNDQYVTMQ